MATSPSSNALTQAERTLAAVQQFNKVASSSGAPAQDGTFLGADSNCRRERLQALQQARQLVLELEDGDAAMFRRLENLFAALVLNWALSIGVLDKVPANGSISATDLAKELGIARELLIRMMRILVINGDFSEPEPDVYAHRKAASMREKSRQFAHMSLLDLTVIPCLAQFKGYFQQHPNFLASPADEPEIAAKAASKPASDATSTDAPPAREPATVAPTPISWAYGKPGVPWIQIIMGIPGALERFIVALSGDWDSPPITGFYPFDSELSSAAAAATQPADTSSGDTDAGLRGRCPLLVDVGAGHATTVKHIRAAYPSLNGPLVLQDLPAAIARLPPTEADALASKDIYALPHDFFTPQPPSCQGATVYYMRRVLHDWNDERCVAILSHLRDAMAANTSSDAPSRVLIADTILPVSVPVGATDGFAYWQDIIMAMIGGKERTEREFASLLDRAGLKLHKVWRAADSLHGIVEGRLP